MASPLRSVHVMLAPEQISHLTIKAAQQHLSMSALIRELVEKDRARDARKERDRERAR